MKMAESSSNMSKILWEKEKLLIMSNFSFSPSVFKRLLLQTCKNQALFWNGLNKKKSHPHLPRLADRCTRPWHKPAGLSLICSRLVFVEYYWQLYANLSSFNPLPNNPWFLCVCSTTLLKTLYEKNCS